MMGESCTKYTLEMEKKKEKENKEKQEDFDSRLRKILSCQTIKDAAMV